MPASQVLNPKGVIKRSTNNDLPFNTSQPVISSYYATSTASQTVINLSFSVDTTNTDIFWLFVDGNKLTLGSSNDYTFTAIGADLTSSQVTLNQSLPASLNIQALKLGLKKESEFLTDNRFTQLYAAEAAGFQGFVDTTTNLMTATSSAGTPTAGTFYSSIVGRAAIADLSQDLKPRFGVDRITLNGTAMPMTSESGPAGQPVYAAIDDTFGQIRAVGTGWQFFTGIAFGQDWVTSNTADYVEITFYGTGLNGLFLFNTGAVQIGAAVDGGSTTTVFSATMSSVLEQRNYNTNHVIPLAQGLALGIHTVQVYFLTNPSNVGWAGFEFINQVSAGSNLINVNPGAAYISGKSALSSAQRTFAYNSVVTGTTGGRVLVYQNAAGSVGAVFNACATSPSLLSSANHSNEEVARTYFWREFGAGRFNATYANEDDFSLLTSTNRGAAFTLEDDSTTLVATSANGTLVGAVDALGFGAVNSTITIYFVGTGLDVTWCANALTGVTITASVDGGSASSIGTVNGTFNPTLYKIVSGLPYGSHSVQFKLTAVGSGVGGFLNFNVYQPKKPSIPSGAILLGDYNVMANYIASTTGNSYTVGQGVLRKTHLREFIHIGTWTSPSLTTANTTGFNVPSATTGSTTQLTFFGTGFEHRFGNTAAAASFTVSVDGTTALNASNSSPTGGVGWTGALTTSFFGPSVASFTASTGTVVTNTTGSSGQGIQVSGLTLGYHTVKITWVSGTIFPETFDIITPIHSHRSNLYGVIDNTLPIGSQSITDSRSITPVKDSLPATKAWAQAFGVTSGPTTASTTLVPCPDLSVSIKTSGGPLKIAYTINASNGTAANNFGAQVYVDGVAVGTIKQSGSASASQNTVCSDSMKIPVSAGFHKVDVFWNANVSGTITANGTSRNLLVEET